MDSPIFKKLQNAILHPSRTKDWFSMAEQAINAVYALAEHPDAFCNEVIKKLTVRAFNSPRKDPGPNEPRAPEATQEGSQEPTQALTQDEHAGDVTMDAGDVTMQDATQATQQEGERELGEAFELAQLLFVVGHVAIKHIVFLELVEREWKRQKDEKQAGEFGQCLSPYRGAYN